MDQLRNCEIKVLLRLRDGSATLKQLRDAAYPAADSIVKECVEGLTRSDLVRELGHTGAYGLTQLGIYRTRIKPASPDPVGILEDLDASQKLLICEALECFAAQQGVGHFGRDASDLAANLRNTLRLWVEVKPKLAVSTNTSSRFFASTVP